MNILIPHSWLLEHIDTDVQPDELQKLVSLCGPSIERIYDREGESVYDIEVTTNRVDSMSVRGIAREVAVILSQFGKSAKLKPLKLPELSSFQPADTTQALPLPKVTLKTAACHRALGIVLRDLHRSATPATMSRRLTQTDQNVHEAIIDITNYITHELGHPCHAFDYDRIMALGGEIIITEAQPGKKFVTLDGVEYTTVGGEIVFENPAGKIIDLPAIMGTQNTSINAETKNVLFWLESLDAKKVRVTSMTHAIRTVAAQLEEKAADPHLADLVMARGVQLFQKYCAAQIASPVYDAFVTPRQPKTIKTPLTTITTYLGLTLPTKQLVQILTDLECLTSVSSDNRNLLVTPPTFRQDLEIPADIVEEIARIYGYQNLPSQLMATAIPTTKPRDVNFDLEFQLKHHLANRGWQELYTYSLVSPELAQASSYALTDHLKIANPLTDDKVYLRRSLLPSLLATATEMAVASGNAGGSGTGVGTGVGAGAVGKIKVFEFANTYTPSKSAEVLPLETMRVSLVSNQDYRTLVGELGIFLAQLYRPDLKIVADKKKPAQATIQLTGKIASTQTLEPQTLGYIQKLSSDWWGIDLELAQLVTAAQTHPVYQPTPKFAGLLEDMTFTLPAQTPIGQVMTAIQAVSPLVHRVEFKNQYQANASFAVVYRSETQSLTSEEVAPIRRQIVTKLQAQFGAALVGQL